MYYHSPRKYPRDLGRLLSASGLALIFVLVVTLATPHPAFAAQTVTLQFSAALGSAAEASGFGNILKVTTSDGLVTSAAKTVTVNVTGGTATSADYNRTGTITIPSGTANNATVSISTGITVTDDNLYEADQTIVMSLSSPSSGAVLGAQTTYTHTITNDEVVTALYTKGTWGIQENAGTITENVVLTITGTTSGTLALEIDVSFEEYIIDLSTTVGQDYIDLGVVTIIYPSGSVSGAILTQSLTIIDDAIDENNEFFDFRVRRASDLVETAQLTFRITDNDTAAVTITQSGGTTAVTEGGAIDTFTVALASQPTSGTVTVQLDPDTQCQLNGNGAGNPITLNFTSSNWNSNQGVIVAAIDDAIDEGTHSCFINNTISASTTAEYPTSLNVADITVTITDNDAPTATPTATATRTNTSTWTNTPTFTPSPTRTNTPTNTATATVTSTSTPVPVCANLLLNSSVAFDANSGVQFTINNVNSSSVWLSDAKIVWKVPAPSNNSLLLIQGQIGGNAWYVNQTLANVNGVTLNSSSVGWQNGIPPDYPNRKIAAFGATLITVSYANGPSNLGTIMSAYDFSGTMFTVDLGTGTNCPLTLNLSTSTPPNTATFTASATNTATNTPTLTPSPTNTPMDTPTLTPSYTNTPTDTPTFTPSYTNTLTNTATSTNTPVPPRVDTVGVYKNGMFYLRNTNSSGGADLIVPFGGDPSDLPVVGDWNQDGVDTVGVYRSATGFFYLSNSNTAPNADYVILFGNPGDAPFAGFWTSDMTGDGIGVYRNSNGILYQRKSLTSGFDDFFAVFGNPGDQAYAGDWEPNGFDSIGIYRSSTQTWYMTNNSQPSGITFSDLSFVWDISSMSPVAGDWDGDNKTNVGYLTPSGVFVLHSNNGSGSAGDHLFVFGPTNGKPIAGKWVAPSRPLVVGVVNPPHPASNVEGNSGVD